MDCPARHRADIFSDYPADKLSKKVLSRLHHDRSCCGCICRLLLDRTALPREFLRRYDAVRHPAAVYGCRNEEKEITNLKNPGSPKHAGVLIAYFLCLHQNPLIHKSVFQTDKKSPGFICLLDQHQSLDRRRFQYQPHPKRQV